MKTVFAFDLHGVLFYYDVRKALRFSLSWKTLRHPYRTVMRAMAHSMYPIAGTVEIMRELHAKGYQLYLFSNVHYEMFEIVKARFHTIFSLFTKEFIHPRSRWLAKPKPEVYPRFIAQEHLAHKRVIFIDDQPRNITAGRTAGMTSILFHSPEQLREELQRLGFI